MAALDGSLWGRINLALKRSREPDPSRIARKLQRTLTEEEKAELIYEALEERVYHLVREQRRDARAQEDLRRLDVLEKERATQREEREDRREQAKRLHDANERALMRDPILRAQTEVSNRLRREANIISLSTIAGQRVCVGGTWLMFEDCTEEQVRALADEYVERAVDLGMRSAYYRAIADTMAEGGFSTVGDMCKGIGLEAAA